MKKPLPAATDVKVPVDRKLKAKWDKLSAAIDRALAEGSASFDSLWESVGDVIDHDPPLYVLGGYASAAEYLEQHLHQQPRTAFRWIRVARYATPSDETRYGTSVLDAVLGYLEASSGPLKRALPIDFSRLKIPAERDGKTVKLPVEALTLTEINAATKALAPTPGRSRASAAHKVLRSALATSKKLSAVQVQEQDGTASFRHVPMSAIREFGKALSKIKLHPEESAPAPKKPKGPPPKKPRRSRKPT